MNEQYSINCHYGNGNVIIYVKNIDVFFNDMAILPFNDMSSVISSLEGIKTPSTNNIEIETIGCRSIKTNIAICTSHHKIKLIIPNDVLLIPIELCDHLYWCLKLISRITQYDKNT